MISFIVLAYNEETNIEGTIETVLRAARQAELDGFEIVAVNDGSTDRTGDILGRLAGEHPQIRVVTNEVNLGVGGSFRRALALAKCERMLIVPGDNDMTFEIIRLLLHYRDAADVVMGFPINTEQRSVWRNFLSVQFRLAYVVAFRVFVNYINAPAICSTAAMRSVPLRSQRFSIIAEYNVKLLRSGCSYAEVPGFFQNSDRDKNRRTVTLKNFIDVVRCFLRLLIEVYVVDRARYRKPPRRVFIDFAGGVIASPVSLPYTTVQGADRVDHAAETRDVRI
jgi:glycosyltransferase involved in cell wall biosynthesis